ncbi:multidrug resistance protein [Robertmurraya siralis]|uniref:Multidrug resistance protein n=1 Tax=Robertmurraya siralis TaxID=77777 RepID=A0A919WJK7_9BACI|nr:MFS transporter [Robertmurraya siralis]GIN62877.1 multidrug resistance protein [Robertmurraya siralis]
MKVFHWDLNLKVRLFGEAIFNLHFWMYFPFIALYFSTELGNSTAGMLMAIPPLISLFGSLAGGSLADRIGRRHVMLMGSSIQALMFVLFALSMSPWLDYLAFIGISFGGAIYRPPSAAMVADLVPEAERRQVFATFTTAKNIGAVLGPALGAIFFFHYRHELLWTCSLILIIYTLVIYLIVKETKHDIHSKSKLRHVMKAQWSDYREIFRDKIFAIYILAGVFAVVTIMQLDLYLPIYVINHVPAQVFIGWNQWSLFLTSEEIFGWMLGLNGLLFVLFVLPVTKWLKNRDERDIFILSSFLSGTGMLALGISTNIWYLFLVTVVFTFGEIVRSPVMESFVSRYAPRESVGKYMGADSLQYTIGRFLAPITLFLSEWLEPVWILSILFASSLFSIYLYAHLFKLFSVDKSTE